MNFSPFTFLADFQSKGSFNLFNEPIFIFLLGLSLLSLLVWYLGAENDKIKKNTGTFFLLGLCSFCLFSLHENGIRKGIDIAGGVSFTLEVKPNIIDGKEVSLTSAAMEDACATITDRLNSTGANEVTVMPQGLNKILIQIPVTDEEKIKEQREIITRIAKLELLPVHPNNDQLVAQGIEFVTGYSPYVYEFTSDNTGETITQKLFLTKRSQLSGRDIKSASVNHSMRGYVNVVLSDKGAQTMWKVTSAMEKGRDRLAIVLDGKVVSAPVVQSNLSKSFQISGLNGPGEAEQLVKVLSNPLTNELTILEERNVSASLGQAALEQGELAGIVGLLICFVLVLVYYRFAGLVAIAALCFNGIILLGCMSLFGFVLTLPGIAGIILTLGVAIDANVLIYERLREEKSSGKPILIAIRNSFDKAFTAIFDSNITTLITAVILFYLSTGTIKGFAVTLTVGIASSMIGALVGTRVLFYWANKVNLLNNMQFLDLFKNIKKIDFMGMRKTTGMISLVLVVMSIGGAFYHKADCLGIDFTGGTSITYTAPKDKEIDFQNVESSIHALPLVRKATVQEFSTPTEKNIIILFGDSQQDMDRVTEAIAQDFPELLETRPSIDQIGQVLGNEFLKNSLYALIAGVIGMMIYLAIRYEWSFAAAALISTIHDIIVVLGVVILMGGEFSIIHVGAILTVAGYSVNDTIIIFDRIREQLRFADPDDNLTDLINDAVNSTLSRTVLTSVSTIAALVSLCFLGGPSLQDFSITILIGIVVGTYSSIYIAPPAIIWFTRKHSLHEEVRKTMEMEMANK